MAGIHRYSDMRRAGIFFMRGNGSGSPELEAAAGLGARMRDHMDSGILRGAAGKAKRMGDAGVAAAAVGIPPVAVFRRKNG